jgi:oligosaccharide repeat unit polymerase
MKLLIPTIIICHLLITQVPRRRRDLLGPSMFMDIMMLGLFGWGIVLGGKLSESADVNWLCTIVITGVLALYIGMYAARPLMGSLAPKMHRMMRLRAVQELSLNRVMPLFYVFFAVAVASAIDSARYGQTDILGQFSGARLTSYGERLSEGSISFFTNIICYLLPFPALAITVAFHSRKRAIGFALYAVTLVAFLATFSTRLWVVTVIALPVAYFHYYIRRIRPKEFCLILLGGVVAFSMLNIWRARGLVDLIAAFSDGTVSADVIGSGLSNDLNPVASLYELVDLDQHRSLVYEHGRTYLYIVVTFVPRALWPNKPSTSFANRWSDRLEGTLLSASGAADVSTFTVWGEGLVQFGWFGVLANLFLYGLVVGCVERAFASEPNLGLVRFCWNLQAGFCLRGEIGALIIFSIMTFGLGFLAVRFSRFKSRRVVQRFRPATP